MRLTYLTLMLALYCPFSYSVYLRRLPEDAPYLYGFSPALLHSSGGFLQLFRRLMDDCHLPGGCHLMDDCHLPGGCHLMDGSHLPDGSHLMDGFR